MGKNANLHIERRSDDVNCSMADEWFDHASSEHFWIKWRFEALKKVVHKDHLYGEVMEVGSGTGVVRRQIEEYYDCVVHGCDLNFEALRRDKIGRGKLYCYDVNQRDADFHNHFSTIFLLDVLEHINEQRVFLRSINFHLMDGGYLILTAPAHKVLYSKYDCVAGHLRRYSMSEISNVLGECGFTIESKTYWGMSLLPVIVLRNMFLIFVRQENVIKRGFQPQNRVIECILDTVGRLERALFSKIAYGISICIVARKDRGVNPGVGKL